MLAPLPNAEQHMALVRRLRPIVGDDAEDVVQNVCVKILEGSHAPFNADGSYEAWIWTVAKNEALSTRRRAKRRREMPLTDLSFEPAVTTEEPGADKRESDHEYLTRLSPRLREAVLAFDAHGPSHTRAAASLRLTPAAFSQRLARARKQCRTFREAA